MDRKPRRVLQFIVVFHNFIKNVIRGDSGGGFWEKKKKRKEEGPGERAAVASFRWTDLEESKALTAPRGNGIWEKEFLF